MLSCACVLPPEMRHLYVEPLGKCLATRDAPHVRRATRGMDYQAAPIRCATCTPSHYGVQPPMRHMYAEPPRKCLATRDVTCTPRHQRSRLPGRGNATRHNRSGASRVRIYMSGFVSWTSRQWTSEGTSVCPADGTSFSLLMRGGVKDTWWVDMNGRLKGLNNATVVPMRPAQPTAFLLLTTHCYTH